MMGSGGPEKILAGRMEHTAKCHGKTEYGGGQPELYSALSLKQKETITKLGCTSISLPYVSVVFGAKVYFLLLRRVALTTYNVQIQIPYPC